MENHGKNHPWKMAIFNSFLYVYRRVRPRKRTMPMTRDGLPRVASSSENHLCSVPTAKQLVFMAVHPPNSILYRHWSISTCKSIWFYLYIYLHTHIHTHTHIYIYMTEPTKFKAWWNSCIYPCMYVHKYIYIYKYVYVCMYAHEHIPYKTLWSNIIS